MSDGSVVPAAAAAEYCTQEPLQLLVRSLAAAAGPAVVPAGAGAGLSYNSSAFYQ